MRDVLAKLGQVVVNDIANKPIAPLHVDEVVRVASKCTVPPFGHKAIHGKVNLVLHGYKMNVMTHGLEKPLPSLPLGIDVQTVYATLADGSNRIMVVLRNNTRDWLEIKKGVPIAWMVTANEVPKVTNLFSTKQTKEPSTLTETERQDLLLEKLDLSDLEVWPQEQAEQARSLLKEYHDILLEKHDMGHTNTTKHKIVLKDPDTPPFKEPPEEKVQEYLNQIPYPGVKAVLNNAIMPIEEHAEQGVRLTPDCQVDCQEEAMEARPARLATTNVTDWKQEQKEDQVLYQVAKHLRAPHEIFKAALHKVLDKKATAAYVKAKEQLLIKNSLLYRKTRQGQADEIMFQFVVPQRHRGATLDGCHQEAAHQGQHRSTSLMQECFWWPGMTETSETALKSAVAVGNMRLLHQSRL